MPSCSDSPVRNTAAWFCMTRCISSRIFAVGVLPFALRSLSSRATASSPAPGRERPRPRAALDELAAALRGRAAEHDEVDQRVRAEPIRAVHGDARRLADRP